MPILAKNSRIILLYISRILVTVRMASTTTNSDNLSKFKSAMQHIYGSFETLSAASSKTWVPVDLAEGHKGRYLWTDGFAVVNFLTLYKETGRDEKYFNCAERLVDKVHSVLGRTRDGVSRLPLATEEDPLLGGLRIGKLDASGEDGDGQYFHYLTIWMYALYQMSLASGNATFLKQAISMAKAVHSKFVYNQNSSRPRMYWKMSMDLSEPLVMSEGNLDPIDGYVIYTLLQKGAKQFHLPDSLSEEIAIFRKIVETKYPKYSSSDALDLGMTLWTTHFLLGEEDWAEKLTQNAQACLATVVKKGYFDRPFSRRLAFRDFGTVLGVKCHEGREEDGSTTLAEKIVKGWESHEAVPVPRKGAVMDRLEPITLVMYATALNPGAFRNGFWKN